MWKQWSGHYHHPLIFSGFISLLILSFINGVLAHLASCEKGLITHPYVSCGQITRLSTRKALGTTQEVW